jgi:hypothetical protein
MADESNDLCVCGHARLYHLTGVGDCEPADIVTRITFEPPRICGHNGLELTIEAAA